MGNSGGGCLIGTLPQKRKAKFIKITFSILHLTEIRWYYKHMLILIRNKNDCVDSFPQWLHDSNKTRAPSHLENYPRALPVFVLTL